MASVVTIFKYLVFALTATFTIANVSKSMIEKDTVVIFSKSYCPYCKGAKKLLTEQGITFTAFELDQMPNGPEIQNELLISTGQNTVPNIFIKSQHVGGFDSITALNNEGKLKNMVQSGDAKPVAEL